MLFDYAKVENSTPNEYFCYQLYHETKVTFVFFFFFTEYVQ